MEPDFPSAEWAEVHGMGMRVGADDTATAQCVMAAAGDAVLVTLPGYHAVQTK